LVAHAKNPQAQMRIVVFAPSLPYPPNRGGKADIWRRILAFRQLGHEVMLVCMLETKGREASTPADLVHVDAVVNSRFSFPIKRSRLATLKQLACSFFVPWHAATRVPNKAQLAALNPALDEFKPDFLWLDGPWFGVLGCAASARFGIPILYRSHNIEHRYILGQAAAAVKVRDQIAWTLACVGLKRFEARTMRRAVAAFDISVDDLQFWEASGMQHMHWLPPLNSHGHCFSWQPRDTQQCARC
jgi:polysaccharide biosynthesis protein PslH